MKFLTKLAQIFAKGLQIVGLFGPAFTQVLPQSQGTVTTVSQDLSQLANIVTDVEQTVGVALALKGPDKLKAATPLVADVILRSSVLANHKVADPVLFNQGAAKIADGMADVVNSLHTDGIVVTSKQA